MNKKTAIFFGLLILLVIGAGVFVLGAKYLKNKVENKVESKMTETRREDEEENTNSVVGKSFTLAEIANHASENDCWMAIDGKVYNATSFISQHPGGKAILAGCGKDASVLFNERPTNNKGPHPESARKILETLFIGVLNK